jgi:tetratricopeptide (TPR) repeat protein
MDQPSRAFVPPNAPIKDAKLLPEPPPARIFGRNRELASSHVALKAGSAIFLHGPAGVGKTAIASILATAYTAEDLGGVLWFSVAEDDADLLLARIGRAYGVNAITEQSNPAERLRLVRALLERNHPLIVLDGLADANAIRDFVRNVASGVPLIITDTVPASGPWTPTLIPMLTNADGGDLLRAVSGLGAAADGDDIDSLCRILGGNPLALDLIGRYIAVTHTTPAETIPLLLSAIPPGTAKADPQQTALAVVYKKLTPLAQGIFLALGALFTSSAGIELIGDLSAMPPTNLAAIMRQLSVHGLVHESIAYGQSRFTMHESVQAYSRRILEASQRLESIENRVLQAIVAYTTRHASSNTADHDRLAAEMDNIVNAAAFAVNTKQPTPVRQFIQALGQQSGDFVALRGYQPELEQLRKLLSILVRTGPDSQSITTPILSNEPPSDSDMTLTMSAPPVAAPAAVAYTPEASKTPVQIDEPPLTADMTRVAPALFDPGTSSAPVNDVHDIHRPQPVGRQPVSRSDAPANIHDIHTPQPAGRQTFNAVSAGNIHDIHTPQPAGRIPAPFAAQVETETSTANAPAVSPTFETTQNAPSQVPDLSTTQNIPPPEPPPHMPELETYIANRGTGDTTGSQPPVTITPITPAAPTVTPAPVAETESTGELSVTDLQVKIADAQRTGDTVVLAHYLQMLGDLYMADNDTARAIPAYRQAIETLRPAEDWLSIGLAMEKLGRAYYTAGQTLEAMQILEQVVQIFNRVNQPNDELRALDEVGSVHDALRDWPKARESHEYALTVARAQGNQRSEAEHLGSLAYAHEMQGDFHDSVHTYRQALHVAYALDDNDLAGQYAYRLGGLLLDDGRTLKQAVALLDEAGLRLPGDSDVQRLIKRGQRRIDKLETSGITVPEAMDTVAYAAAAYPTAAQIG